MIKFGKAVPADVETRLPHLVDELSGDPRIDAVWLFGSRARGEADALSDVDLAVLARTGLEGPALWDAEIAWTSVAIRVLGTEEVAVQVMNRLPVALRHSILRSARTLWARTPEAAADFMTWTIREYLDLKPYLDRYDRELFRRAAAGSLR